MNTPVSFPLAKVLKEKGFDEVSQKWYSVEGGCYFIDEFNNNRGFVPTYECEAPTISDVVMWLYKNHKIWISVDPENDTNTWFHTITHGKSTTVFGNYSSLTEAYEAGIEDVLINMI